MISNRAESLVAINGAWAGLGNRIRFTLSAQAIADAQGREFSYVWPTPSGVFAPTFTDLWEYRYRRRESGSVIPNLTEHDAHFGRRRTLAQLRGMRRWAILGSSALYGDGMEASWESMLPTLTPVTQIKEQVAEVRRRLPSNYIGVQIRASHKSHSKTLALSPVSWFVQRMEEQIRREPDAHFFLSCDDPKIQSHVAGTVPNVIVIEKKGEYNSLQGVRSAVADLYLLSRSNHLIGPYWSSFVELAWILGGKSQSMENSVHIFPHHGAIYQSRPVSPDHEPPPSDFSVRNPILVAWNTASHLRRSIPSEKGS